MRVFIVVILVATVGITSCAIPLKLIDKTSRSSNVGTAAFPNDSDGNALRLLVENGCDMSKSMDIDYMVHVTNEESGYKIATEAAHLGYKTSVKQDRDTGEWTCYCTKKMLATYIGIIEAQKELDRIANPYSGYSDGWGTFGNKE